MSDLVIILRLLVAAILGGLIGIEREISGCTAGLRTHILVCIGSTLFMMTSINIALYYSNLGAIDPSRIASGVVTGIGFLGAGAIIRYGSSIRGLTTAASIWAVAAVGLAMGAGVYRPAVVTTFLALAVLILSRLEEHFSLKRHGKKLWIRLRSDSGASTVDIRNIIETYGGRVKRVAVVKEEPGQSKKFAYDIILSPTQREDVVTEISSLPGVEEVEWG